MWQSVYQTDCKDTFLLTNVFTFYFLLFVTQVYFNIDENVFNHNIFSSRKTVYILCDLIRRC